MNTLRVPYIQLILFLALTLYLYSSSIVLSAQENSEMKFISAKDWQEIYTKAKREHKKIMIDCNASWCTPCKRMALTIFTQKEVYQFYNQNFICVDFDIDHDKLPPKIASQVSITSVPLFVFLDPEEERVIHAHAGATKDAKEFIELGCKALSKRENLLGLKKRYDLDSLTLIETIEYLHLLDNSGQKIATRSEITDKIMRKVSAKDLLQPRVWDFVSKELQTTQNPLFEILLTNYVELNKQRKDFLVTQKIEQLIENDIRKYAQSTTYTSEQSKSLLNGLQRCASKKEILYKILTQIEIIRTEGIESFDMKFRNNLHNKQISPIEASVFLSLIANHFTSQKEKERMAHLINHTLVSQKIPNDIDLYVVERNLWMQLKNNKQVERINKIIENKLNPSK